MELSPALRPRPGQMMQRFCPLSGQRLPLGIWYCCNTEPKKSLNSFFFLTLQKRKHIRMMQTAASDVWSLSHAEQLVNAVPLTGLCAVPPPPSAVRAHMARNANAHSWDCLVFATTTFMHHRYGEEVCPWLQPVTLEMFIHVWSSFFEIKK